jgi:hypothetical protein
MKVYSTPVPFPEPNYANYDTDKELAREDAHQAELKAWLVANGATGPRTGQILREPWADGSANYMYADRPKGSYLVLLPYGDAWQSPNVAHLPKAEVLKRLDRGVAMAKLFS